MKKLLILFAFIIPLSCTSGGNALEKCLNEEELDMARRVTKEVYVNIYNTIAGEGVTEKPDIIEKYFDNGLRISELLGTMDTICPDYGFANLLFSLFDEDVVARFVEYDPTECRCVIKKDGKYMEVLSKMSHRNGFYKGFYNFMQKSDGCTGIPYIIALNYKSIDFEKEDEQFIAYLALLTRPDIAAVKFAK